MAYGDFSVNDITGIGNNDEEMYLKSAHSKAKKMKSESKGKAMAPKYGSDRGADNEKYSQRRDGNVVFSESGSTSDEKKIQGQALPNTRMYSYLE